MKTDSQQGIVYELSEQKRLQAFRVKDKNHIQKIINQNNLRFNRKLWKLKDNGTMPSKNCEQKLLKSELKGNNYYRPYRNKKDYKTVL